MTQEDKKLLFKDLSARLPYHVKVKVWLKDGTTEEGFLDLEHNYKDVLLDTFFYYNKIKDIKPYLRPMSSMTTEEICKIENIIGDGFTYRGGTLTLSTEEIIKLPIYKISNLIQFTHSRHLDLNNLIPMGLAIAVDENNNPYEE